MKILETETQLVNQTISSEIAAGEYTATRTTNVYSEIAISSVNTGASTFTFVLRKKTAAGAMILEERWTRAKLAGDLVCGAQGGLMLKSGEKIEWRVESTNASDSAVVIDITWLDADHLASDALDETWLHKRFANRTQLQKTAAAAGTLTVYADDGTTAETTQAVTDDGEVQTIAAIQ